MVVDAPLLSSHTALNCPWTHYWLAVLIWPESEVHRQKTKMEQEGDSASLSHGWCPSAKSNITSPLESMYLVCVYVLLAVCFDLMCCVLAGKSIFLSQFDCRCYVQNSMLNLVLVMSSQF